MRKPIQYVGGELNATSKPWDQAAVRWALMYPDAYEVGCPTRACRSSTRCSTNARTCRGRTDLFGLAGHGSVDARKRHSAVHRRIPRPGRRLRRPGGSFATELGYTNPLTALDLAGIPLHAADRGDDHPLVIAGGHAAFNPNPSRTSSMPRWWATGKAVLAPSDLIRDFKAEGGGSRAALLDRVAASGVAYVPSRYEVSYLPDGRIHRVVPVDTGTPWRVAKHTVSDLDQWPYPKQPLVPLAETVHERASVEIFRAVPGAAGSARPA